MGLTQVADGLQTFVLEHDQIAHVDAVMLVQTQTPTLAINEDLLVSAASVNDVVNPPVMPRFAFPIHKLRKHRPVIVVWTTNKVLHVYPVAYIKTLAH
jgi:hypothetical protein